MHLHIVKCNRNPTCDAQIIFQLNCDLSTLGLKDCPQKYSNVFKMTANELLPRHLHISVNQRPKEGKEQHDQASQTNDFPHRNIQQSESTENITAKLQSQSPFGGILGLKLPDPPKPVSKHHCRFEPASI